MNFLRDLTLGHYYPGSSSIHSLDPRVKLIGFLLSSVTLFAVDATSGLVVFFGGSLFLVRLAHLPLATVLRGLRPFVGLFLLTACLQLFFTRGHPLIPISLGPLAVTWEGLQQGVHIGGQLFLFILCSSVFTLTTSPLELLRALEKSGAPLRRLRIPTTDLCLAVLLCIRFLPIVREEAQRILEAQKVRGVDPGLGTWRNRLQKFHMIFLALLYNIFWRAEELATAMAVRGFGQTVEKQTFKHMRLSPVDCLGLGVIVTWCSALIWLFRS